ncbi:MAG: OmpA family protein [Oceanicaulis sp.]
MTLHLLFAGALAAAGLNTAAIAQERSADDIREAIRQAREAAAQARANGGLETLGRTRGLGGGPSRSVYTTDDRINQGVLITYQGDLGGALPSAAAPSPASPAAAAPREGAKLSWVYAADFQQIQFEYDSTVMTPASARTVGALAQALITQSPANGRFLLQGHTDASGSDAYNLVLSYRRAIALREQLINSYGVPAALLVAEGRGEAAPGDRRDPYAARNRRVEVWVEVDA